MFNINTAVLEGRVIQINNPASSQFSTSSQGLQTESSTRHEEEKRNEPCPPPRPSDETSSDQTNSVVNELNQLVESVTKGTKPKMKNAKKKQRKQLEKLATGTNGVRPNLPTSSPIAMNSSVHDFFASHSAAQANSSPNSTVYASPPSRYMTNMINHPQFQYMQNLHNTIELQQLIQSMSLQNSPHAMSAPNTPIGHFQQRLPSTSIPCSPQSPHTNIQFFQNVTQHPLLCHTLNMNQNFNVSPAQNMKPQSEKSAKNKKAKNKEAKSDEKKFENYLSKEEVDEGLKNGTLFEGVLRINPKQFQQGFISTSVRDEQDIFIDGVKNRNRALEGDVVVVQLIEAKSESNNEDESEKSVKDPEVNNAETKLEDSEVKVNNTETNVEGSGVKANNAETKIEDSEAKVMDPETKLKDSEVNVNSTQRRGKVVYILEKVHTRTAIGNLKLMPDKNRQRALFIPRDFRIPRLNIPFTCWPDNFYQDAKKYEDTLFLAKIVDWFDTRFARATIVANIGQSGDMQTETKAILAQNDLDVTPFGPEIRHLFPRLDYTIPEEEIKLREDCRKLCIYSIDPSNCRDIDDAMSCRKLENGNYEIGVHISDVSHYLTENTILDEKVAKRATTIYLVEKAYHMLPDELCMLCSLFPGVDKLAFSVFWEITKDGEVLSHRFAKTIINCCAQLSYDHAQAILEDKDDAEADFPETYNGFQYKEIYESIQIIGGIAAKFRKNRFENGALRIDRPKVAFQLNAGNGLPESYWIYEIKESNEMIEEFMLLANMTVANRIYEDFPNLAFLRCHPPPSGYMLKQLAKSLEPLGIVLDISSAKDLHRSLLPYTKEGADIGTAMVLNELVAKPMTRAKYFCAAGCEDEDFHHYALNVPLYTHFTSPIRRYADIMVHRLLGASLKYRPTPEWEVDNVRMVAAQCNKQKYNAKMAGKMSSELYMLKYVEMHSPVETEAVVVEVRDKYIDVIMPALGLNRRIFFNNDFPGEFNCVKHEGGSAKMSKMEVKWRAEDGKPETQQVIETFSVLKVHMHKSDDMIKVETKLIRPH